MRFGKTLQNSVYPPWKDKYIQYEKLKKLLREDEASPQGRGGESSWTEKDEENFVHELTNVELEKVHQHQVDTFNSLRDRTAACESRLQPTAAEGAEEQKEKDKKAVAQATLKELDGISKEITELKKFSRINYTGFLKSAKKHDRKRGLKYRVRPLLQVRLSQMPFNSEDYSPLLYRLSTMYAWARQILEGEDPRKESSTSMRPKDTYTAHKFWVHVDNLLEVKTYILRRLPVLVYNPQSMKIVDGSQKDPTITSIYFDNEKFELYQQKVDKVEQAGSLRLRWSGQLADKPEVVLEKKVVSDEAGSRDIRVQIKEKYIQPFLKGEYRLEKQIAKLEERLGADNEQVQSLKSNVEEIQEFIKDKRLESVLRATYTRTAFQIPGDDRIRISLDTDLALIREDALDTDRPCRDPDDWHRADIDGSQMEYPYPAIKKGEISRFQHAILEIKVKDTKYTRNNAWLQDLMNSHLVKEAPKFSKFVHGIAQLFEDYVNSFPFWLSDLETDIRRDPEQAFQDEQDKLARIQEDEIAVGSFLPVSSLSRSFQGKSSSPRGKLPDRKVSSSYVGRTTGTSVSQLEPTAEERDSDDDGIQGDSSGVNGSSKGVLASFLPAFSNSRYARRHRQGNMYKDAPLPEGVKTPAFWIKDQGPLKVEAKVWLANQRTFVKWQHIAVLLATLSLGLYNAAGVDNNIARGLAIVYTAFAVFAGTWGWAMYLWRSRLITERSGKDFDNMTGPIIVSIGLALALVLNFAFKYSAVMTERQKHHDHSHSNNTVASLVENVAEALNWEQEL